MQTSYKTTVKAVVFGTLLLMAGSVLAAPGVVEKTSNNDFNQTVQKIKSSVTANKLVILKELNQQKMVKMVGVHAEPSISFEVFHPRFGKAIHANDNSAFLAVPLRILVQQDGNKVKVYYQQASALFAPYNGLDDLGRQLDKLMANIVDAATK